MTSEREVALARRERDAAAVKLRRKGLDVRAIARELGIEPQEVTAAIARQLHSHVSRDVALWRALQSERYEAQLAVYWDASLAGDPDAFSRTLSLLDRISRLWGVNMQAPAQNHTSLNLNMGATMDGASAWEATRTRLVGALAAFPQARESVVKVLRESVEAEQQRESQSESDPGA